ncbi:winged helix-turn-helix domain-containing protein [Massilia sp. IC2-477]|uniref:ATP-binding protein n=1 Tax=Massilia sp. IC2-477 TaxID=2887198 RepID=UPI001D0FA918|nr:winged helix-turn-helix domain-containing protein [Massilia sp. IC2-477]MCC2957558.1 winged helix-turn-helix domain-containing protein [Massilia sp. IC2-477]
MGKQEGPAFCETGGETNDGSIQFGPFELWPEQRELRRDGVLVQLSARAIQLLTILVQRAGEVIGRRELAGQLWPDGGVDDSSLRAHVAALRRTLGHERYILNVLGRGYTFVGRCRRRAAAPPAAVHGQLFPGGALPGAGTVLGRDETIALLSGQVLRQRLVSVVGAGGVGKSMVARAVAHRLAQDFADGVCLADFAAVVDAEDVARTLACALGIATVRGDPMRAVCEALDGARLLVVMDNCSHLADAVAVLVEHLLAQTRAPHLLVTSREALCLQDERVHRLAPLDTSDGKTGLGSAAVQLFRRRAGDLGVRFDVDDEARIDRMCQHLEGNPLAIELAAVHACERGLDSIEAGFDWLFTPSERWRGGDARHRSFGNMLDWSVEMLPPQERTVLRRLAVFHGRFTMDWAAEVCSCTHISPAQVVECTLALGAKSLVNVVYDGAAPHYRLSNTTRLYVRRRLMRNLEAADLQRRHAASVTALCRRAHAELLHLPASQWRARHTSIPGELGVALDWCFSPSGDPMLGIELAAAARFVMCELGRGDEHRGRILQALRMLDGLPGVDARLEQRLLIALTLLDSLFLDDGGQEDAEWARVRLLELASRDGADEPLVSFQAIAGWGLGQGCYRVVLEMAERIAACAGRTAEPDAVVLATRLRAQGLHFLGRHEEAQAQARAALDNAPTRRTVHYLSKVPVPVSMGVLQARTLWIRGRPDSALHAADEALARAEGHHPHALCMALGLAAIPIALWRGDSGLAQVLAQRFAGLVEHAGIAFWQPWSDCFRYLLEPGHAASGHAPLPSNSVLRDMLATFDSRLVDAGCLGRVREGLVGWNAPEVLRADGVRRLADHGARGAAEAAGLFLRARSLARAQGALGWELRAAVSLAELWTSGERGEDTRRALAELLARFDEGLGTGDLVRARTLLARTPQRQPAGALWCSTLLD